MRFTIIEQHTHPFDFQDTHQEEIIHNQKWQSDSFRYVLEGSGDIFRELSKNPQSMHYIGEKLDRISFYFKKYEKYTDDTIVKAWQVDKKYLTQLLNYWKQQPTETPEQEVAKELNIELIMGNIDEVKKLMNKLETLEQDKDWNLKFPK